jgi:hypothetical protein
VLTFLRQFLCMVAVSHRLAFSFLHPGWWGQHVWTCLWWLAICFH